MATEKGFADYVVEQLNGVNGEVRAKKMFGEYGIFVNGKCLLLVCDDRVFAKITDVTTAALGADTPTGYPYDGAKVHFELDVDDRERLAAAINAQL